MYKRLASSALLLCLILCAPLMLGQSKPVSTPAGNTPAPLASATAALPNPKTPAEFLARARQLSDLEASGIPFHLKATFVATGDAEFLGNGTYEEWWQSKNIWRKEATLGPFRLVSINTPKGPLLYANSRDIPEPLIDAMGAALINIAPDEGTAGNWRIKQKKIQGTELTMLSTKPMRSPEGGAGLEQAFYFTSNGILRIQQSFQTDIVYNDVRPYRTLLIPRSIETRFDQKRLLKISIEALEPLSAGSGTNQELTAIPNDLSLIGNYMIATPGLPGGNALYQPPPRYPAQAKAERIQGTVVLNAVIDENGEVSDLRVIKSPDISLTSAALDAVRQWRYKPTTVDNKPVAVYTTIRVVFAMYEGPSFTRSYLSGPPQ